MSIKVFDCFSSPLGVAILPILGAFTSKYSLTHALLPTLVAARAPTRSVCANANHVKLF
jgi:hypothetical protein